MNWVIILTLLMSNGVERTFDIPASGVYVRTQADCLAAAKRIMEDYQKIYGAEPVSAHCKPY